MEQLLNQISDFFLPKIKAEVANALHEYKTQLDAPKDDKLYSRKETSQKLNVSLVTLNQYVKDNKIIAHRIGSRVLFKAEDIEKCLSKIKVSGGAYQK